jgi:hypothetical protein
MRQKLLIIAFLAAALVGCSDLTVSPPDMATQPRPRYDADALRYDFNRPKTTAPFAVPELDRAYGAW